MKISGSAGVKASDCISLEDIVLRNRSLLLLILACIVALSLAAQCAELPKLETKVKTLAAFKNGLGFAFRSGNTSLADGWVDMNEIPPASLGTLWIGTTNPLRRVEEVVSYKATNENAKDAQTVAELIDLNVGKTIGLTYWSGGSQAPQGVTGKVISSTGQVVIIQPTGTDGKRAIRKDMIQTLEMPSDGALKGKETTNRAKIRVGGKPKSAEVTMAYLEKGITWSPSYLVNIRDAKTADITLEAVLANDTEDLEDTDVSFVVGYPNFTFADITTPMSLQQSVAAFVQALTNGRQQNYNQPFSNVMAQSVAYNYALYDSDVPSPSSWQPELGYSATKPMAGESNEDLYFYHQPHVTLKKGDRARYTVFTGKASYEHLYELDVPDARYVDYRGYRTSDNGNRKDEETQVWHVLRLTNTTDFPWTTAPALTVNGSMPIAQDTLKYTPPKGKNTLKLTIATDIRAQEEQTEASREQVTILGDGYDSVTVDGKLTIRSYKANPVKMSVKKSMLGQVLASSDGGKVAKLVTRLTAANPDSQVSWEFELAPGAEKVLTYQYKVMIRR